MTDVDLRALALRTLLPGFAGTSAPKWALELLDEGLGGYILFGYNIAHPAQVAELTSQLRAVRPDALIGADEEGGDVTRLHHAAGSPYPGNAALGAVDDVELTRKVHRAIGDELRAVGVTVNCAPAVDINVADDNPVIGTRSFGRDPRLVARHAAAAVAGLQDAGVAACAKHFPGHGATVDDSHHTLPTVDVPLDVLRERELVPFTAAIEAGTKVIMTGHIRVPVLTGDLPATLSPAALTDLLRGEMGYTGAVMTDAVEMRGVSGERGIPASVALALAAGCDLVCFGGEQQKNGPMVDLVHATVDAIVAAVRSGELPEERLYEAAKRGDELRGWLSGVGDVTAAEAAGVGAGAARRAVHVEGTLPNLSDALIVQVDTPGNIAVGDVPWGVTPLLAKRLADAETMYVDHDSADVTAVTARADGRSVVVVARDTHRHQRSRSLVEGVAASGVPTVLVEMGWPAAWRPAGAAAYVATYGAAPVNAEAATEALLGH
ncbi:sugar hydrolase [Actinorhabdospora filicis]|uniref:Sugar hydrolase n=1 Tax=Actinorhabdospora filicis TaxID=1785913 RepID=A0A9W6SGY7_9ACTN|nr:glycoside hydrolase family 3 N-terminal domain-containing protein [Actinorhabdospora filicis]GLZ75808.1 sugar hydrolase [Actinorhabdospora filicis]